MATTHSKGNTDKSKAAPPTGVVLEGDPPAVKAAVEKYAKGIASRTDLSDATKEAMLEKYAARMREILPGMLAR